MPFPPIPPREYQGVLNLKPEQDNENLKTAIEEAAKDYQEFVRNFRKNPPSPLVKLPRREQWEKHQLLIYEAYRGDLIAAQREADLLFTKDYVDLLRDGQMQLPKSRPWIDLLTIGVDAQGVPELQGAWFLLREIHSDYRALAKEFGGYEDAE